MRGKRHNLSSALLSSDSTAPTTPLPQLNHCWGGSGGGSVTITTAVTWTDLLSPPYRYGRFVGRCYRTPFRRYPLSLLLLSLLVCLWCGDGVHSVTVDETMLSSATSTTTCESAAAEETTRENDTRAINTPPPTATTIANSPLDADQTKLAEELDKVCLTLLSVMIACALVPTFSA